MKSEGKIVSHCKMFMFDSGLSFPDETSPSYHHARGQVGTSSLYGIASVDPIGGHNRYSSLLSEEKRV